MLTAMTRRSGGARAAPAGAARADRRCYFGRLAIWARNGLAVVYQRAMPAPMMNEASIRPSSRKTLVCSTPISSGWRAADSRYLLAMMPTPTQAPSAPRPIMRPAATATRPMSSMLTPEFGESGKESEKRRAEPAASVRVVGLADVDQGEHHEHESLQRDDQDVEHRPCPAEADVQQRQTDAAD